MVATLAHLLRLGWRLAIRVTVCRGHRASVLLRGWGRGRIDPNCLVLVLLLMVANLAHFLGLGWRLTFRVTLFRGLRVSVFLRGRGR